MARKKNKRTYDIPKAMIQVNQADNGYVLDYGYCKKGGYSEGFKSIGQFIASDAVALGGALVRILDDWENTYIARVGKSAYE